MKWMQILLGGAVIFIGLKLFLKTLKFFTMIAIAVAAMAAFWLWQHGMLPINK